MSSGKVPPGIMLACVPSSIMGQWEAELKAVLPQGTPILRIHGSQCGKERVAQLREFYETPGFRVAVTTLPTLFSMSKHRPRGQMAAGSNWAFCEEVFSRVVAQCCTFVIDEAHIGLCNRDNAIQRFVAKLRFTAVGLTATPLKNNIRELFSLIESINVDFARTYPSVLDRATEPNDTVVAQLRRAFEVRRTREQLGIRNTRIAQRSVFHQFEQNERDAYAQSLASLESAYMHYVQCRSVARGPVELALAKNRYMRAVTRVRMVNMCASLPGVSKYLADKRRGPADPGCLGDLCEQDNTTKITAVAPEEVPITGRLAKLVSFLQELHRLDRPVLVFAEFCSIFAVLLPALERLGVPARQITGAMRPTERTEAVDDWKSGQVRLLFLSITAAGVGLDLVQTKTVVFLQSPMSPAVLAQAIGRADRRTRDPNDTIEVVHWRTVGDTGMIMHTVFQNKTNHMNMGIDGHGDGDKIVVPKSGNNRTSAEDTFYRTASLFFVMQQHFDQWELRNRDAEWFKDSSIRNTHLEDFEQKTIASLIMMCTQRGASTRAKKSRNVIHDTSKLQMIPLKKARTSSPLPFAQLPSGGVSHVQQLPIVQPCITTPSKCTCYS